MALPETQQVLAALAVGNASSRSGASNVRIAAGNVPTIASSVCLLGGVMGNHPLSYMQGQCADKYTGNLCATCAPGYTLDVEFECR